MTGGLPARMRALCAASLALFATAALAQTWPAKPLRWIVPYPPGGSVDIAARPVAERVALALGTTSVIENRAGAAGNIGIEAAARSPADGSTILVGPDTMSSNPHLYKVSWDAERDFAAVIQLARQPVVLAVPSSLGISTVNELVALARQKPGLGYATSGSGSQQHMAGEWFARIAGIQLTHVPYKGGGQAIADLVGGQVPVGSLGSSPVIPHAKSGKLRILAQSTKSRAPSLPEVPTYEEAGIRGLVLEQWIGIFVPAGARADVVTRLNGEIAKALADPSIRERYALAALEPVGGSAGEFARHVRETTAMYGRLVRELNIRVE